MKPCKDGVNIALELSKVNTKMYRYLGVCIGAMILIFII